MSDAEVKVKERMSLDTAFNVVLNMAEEKRDEYIEEARDTTCEMHGIDPLDPPDDIDDLMDDDDIEVIEEYMTACLVVSEFLVRVQKLRVKMGVAK